VDLDRYDSIIIGAGHNGLVCAAYLARSGQRVLVLEAADQPGGMGANREFHPGFNVSVAHTISHFSQTVARDLELAKHGLEANPVNLPTVGLGEAGKHIVLDGDSVSGVDADDAASLPEYLRSLQRFASALKPFWLKTMPGIGERNLASLKTFGHMGLNIRRMGKKDMREFLRVATLPARDLVDENFNDPQLKAILSWDGLTGSKLAPRSPNGAVLAMLYRMSGASKGGHVITAGGTGGLIDALQASAVASGVNIRCASEVSRVQVEGSADGLRATGVEMTGGEVINADRVISAVDPQRTFLGLVGVEYLDIGFTNRIRRLRCQGQVAKLHLALDGLPDFTGLDRPDGRMIVAANLDAIEFAYDNAKYGEIPTNPVLEIVVPSVHDAELAPDGKHVLSAHVMYVPFKLKGGWTDDARDAVRQRAIETIARYAPGIREQILGSELLTPLDLQQQYRVTGGHWHHTEFAIDQMLMMRPTYEAAQYTTPIPGLFLCGAGCHPGGDLTGAPGHNAAREILR
jgi:phytoene dehydrogenase-like protein